MDTQAETLGQMIGDEGLTLSSTAISDLFFNSMEAAQAESIVAGGDGSIDSEVKAAASDFADSYLHAALEFANIDHDPFVDALVADYLGRR